MPDMDERDFYILNEIKSRICQNLDDVRSDLQSLNDYLSVQKRLNLLIADLLDSAEDIGDRI